MALMERVTGIGGVFQRAGQAASLRDWYAEQLGIDISEWGGKPFEWTPGGSTTWAIFDHDTEYFGRPEQAFMVNFRVADLDAMLAQLRSAGVEVIDALEESEYGRFGWAVDPEGTRFEIWEPPPGHWQLRPQERPRDRAVALESVDRALHRVPLPTVDDAQRRWPPASRLATAARARRCMKSRGLDGAGLLCESEAGCG